MKKLEELEFEVSSKAVQLKKFLLKTAMDRMPFEVIQVAQILKKVGVFQRCFDLFTQQFADLPLKAQIEQYKHGELIYSSNDEADCMYIIIEGIVSISHNDHMPFELTVSMPFGEVDILFSRQIRTTSARCTSQQGCSLMKLKRYHVDCLILPDINMKQKCKFLKRQVRLQNLADFHVEMLATRLEQRKFAHNQWIFMENEVVEKIYWLLRGSVAVIKKMVKNDGKIMNLQVDTLQQSDTFGEFYCLNKEASDVSLCCCNAGSYYSLNLLEIVKMCPKLLGVFEKESKKYPSNAQILEIYKLECKEEQHRVRKLRECKDLLAAGKIVI